MFLIIAFILLFVIILLLILLFSLLCTASDVFLSKHIASLYIYTLQKWTYA